MGKQWQQVEDAYEDETWTEDHYRALERLAGAPKGELLICCNDPDEELYDDLWRRGLVAFTVPAEPIGLVYWLTGVAKTVLKEYRRSKRFEKPQT